MPKLSDSMADAVIVRWLKTPGDSFERGEALIEVETDKATVVYEAEAPGTLESILVPEGASASIGDPIAMLANGGGPPAAMRVTPARRGGGGKASGGQRGHATPVARRPRPRRGPPLPRLSGT